MKISADVLADWSDRPFSVERRASMRRAGKRVFDVTLALALLIASAPLFGFVAFSIYLRDGAPIFFGHERIGRKGAPFACLKFRTMVREADVVLADLLSESPESRAEWDATQKLRDDPRILGRVGGFLRRTSLDELPQLVNVLRGEMSLVGPRPVTRDELVHYGSQVHWYLAARPGLSGPWQVSGRSDTGYDTRVQLDVDYVRAMSFRRDVAILLRTVAVVVTGRGAY